MLKYLQKGENKNDKRLIMYIKYILLNNFVFSS